MPAIQLKRRQRSRGWLIYVAALGIRCIVVVVVVVVIVVAVVAVVVVAADVVEVVVVDVVNVGGDGDVFAKLMRLLLLVLSLLSLHRVKTGAGLTLALNLVAIGFADVVEKLEKLFTVELW